MHCETCGAENPVEARFCPKCGAELPSHCSSCGARLPSGARFCPACGQPAQPILPTAAKEDKGNLRFSVGEFKQVTVLFADFCDFTSFSNKRDPEEVHDYMNSLWKRLDPIIIAHGGIIEKHIGDAIMATFGARQAREDEAGQAVRTALAMQSSLAELPESLRMRIGIHTGRVVLGPVGTVGESGPMGDTVNLASRLEESAPAGGVLISHDTYRLVYGMFDVQRLPPLAVQGLDEPVQAYQILGARPRSLARALRGIEGVETQMIGREPELGHLQSALQGVMEARQLQMVTIVGEAGIGKSCLLNEFRKWVEALPQGVRYFCGRATAEMVGLPFALVRDVFASRFDILENDPSAVAREKFERGLAGLLGVNGSASSSLGPESLLQAHFIGQLLGLDFSASPHLRNLLNDAEQIRQRAFHYLSRFFRAITECSAAAQQAPGRSGAQAARAKGEAGTSGLGSVGPVQEGRSLVPLAALLVLEDIHWSDDGSLDLIDYLARTCQGVPLMIVCLARPSLFERRLSWGEGLAGHTRLPLDSLSPRQSRLLVESILRRAPEIPQALRQLVVSSAEGNPFYIEEIIKMLIDQEVIFPAAGAWRIEPKRLAIVQVPPTLTGVLQARLDALLPSERAVLQRASVVGRVFWDSAIERLSSPADRQPALEGTLSKQEILDALAGLRRKEIIFRREASAFAGAVEYIFKHELLRNVTYAGVLKKIRRDYHARVAAWLIDSSGERVSEFTGLVAAHFEQGGRLAEAAEWYGRAGQQARASFAPATAVEFFCKALKLLPAERAAEKPFLVKRMEWHEGLGESLGSQARFGEALEACASMRALAEATGDLAAQARAWNGQAFLQERRGDNRASVQSAERAERLAREAGAVGRLERIKALYLKGWACYRIGDAPAVLALGEQTLNLCAEFGDRPGLVNSFKLHGVAHLQLGHFADADRFFQQGLALSREFDDRRNAAAMLSNLGESARLRGDDQSATELYQKAIAIVQQIGHRDSEAIYLANLSGAHLGLGQFQQAEAQLRQVIALTGVARSAQLAETYSFLSRALLGQSRLTEALKAARHALSLSQETESLLDQGGAWRALGLIAAAMKKPKGPAQEGGTDAKVEVPDPRACFSESLKVFQQMNAEGEQARTLLAWAEFERQDGQAQESRNKSEAARSIFAKLGMTAELERGDSSCSGQG